MQPISNLSAAGKVAVPIKAEFHSLFGERIIYRIADFNHEGYPENSATLITDGAIFAMCFDAFEPENPNSERQTEGNNRYIHSNIAQWLNSDAPPGQWYHPAHPYDAPPTAENVYLGINPSASLPGFLHIFEPWFVSHLFLTDLVVRQPQFDGDGTDAFQAKVFLASTTELGAGTEGSINEGPVFPIFSSAADRICSFTPEAEANCTISEEGPAYWWCRTPFYRDEIAARSITPSGTRSYPNAYSGAVGVRPLCNIPNTLMVSDTPDEEGVYTLLPPQPQTSGLKAWVGSPDRTPIRIPSIIIPGHRVIAGWVGGIDGKPIKVAGEAVV